VGGARVGRRDRVLTRGRAPQDGATPLWIAAAKGHQEVVRALVDAGADKNAPNKVRQGEGGRAHERCWFLLGSCSKAAECQRSDEDRCTVQCSMDGNRSG
jgi:hypothetical protein